MKYFPVEKFTGRMMTEGDPTNIMHNDASLLVNLRAKMGKLFLDRTKFCVDAITTKSVTYYGYYKAAHSWMAPDGKMVLVHILQDDSPNPDLYRLLAWYGTTNTLNSTLGPKTFAEETESPRSYRNIFLASKNVLRIGHEETYYPSTILYKDGSINMYTDFADGMGVGVITPSVYSHIESYNGSILVEVNQCLNDTTGAKNPAVDYNHHDIGIDLVPYGPGKFESNIKIHYAISCIYDGHQESALEQCPIYSENGDAYNGMTIRLFIGNSTDSDQQLDPRITHINLYRAVTDSAESAVTRDYMLLLSIPISGTFSTDKGDTTWAAGPGGGGILTTLNYVTITDDGRALSDSYYSRTGVKVMNTAVTDSNERKNIVSYAVKWDIGCVAKGRALVNCLARRWNNAEEVTEKTIAVSEPNQYDVFKPGSEIIIGEADNSNYVAMKNLGYDRVALFDANHCYILNVANEPVQWYVEKVLRITVHNADNVTKTGDGLFVSCDNGLYFIDQFGEMTEMSIGLRAYWRALDHSQSRSMFDTQDKTLLVTSIASGGDNDGWLFDINNAQVCVIDDNGSTKISGNVALFPGLDNANILLGWAGAATDELYIRQQTSNSDSTPFKYESPSLNMDQPNLKKRGCFLDITYLSSTEFTLTAACDDDLSADTVTHTVPLSATRITKRLAIPVSFRSIKVSISGETTGSFELYDYRIYYFESRT